MKEKMPRLLILLFSTIVFFSCNKENLDNEAINNENYSSRNGNSFKVEKDDIEKVVNDFLYNTINTKSTNNPCKIVAIDSIQTNYSTTKSSNEMNIPHNLLYFVKLSDGSTIIAAGDKRAEPIYAYFENLDLKINDEGELLGQDSVPDMVVFLVENCIVDTRNKTKNNDQLNSYYDNKEGLVIRSVNSNVDQVKPKLAFRFTDAYNYKERSGNYNLFSSQDIRPWTIHALCVAIPDNVEIRSFDGYKLKASWKRAKKLDVTQLQGDLFQDFVAMSNKIPQSSGVNAFNTIKNFFSGADGIPSLSYDNDWYNMLNNLRLETGISYISGYRDRKHPTFFKKTSYHNFSFFLADGYKKIKGDYYIHVMGPIGNNGIVSGYVLDLNRKNAGRFQDTHWTEWFGVPYKTETLNIHTTKYLPK